MRFSTGAPANERIGNRQHIRVKSVTYTLISSRINETKYFLSLFSSEGVSVAKPIFFSPKIT